MANLTGRLIAPLVLSLEERSYLERQVRRHRVSRSLSERCRIILRCAEGIPSKVVATELGVHEHTVGKWRRRFLGARVEGLLDEARPGRPRRIDDDQVDGGTGRLFPYDDPSYVGRIWAATAPISDVQAFQRSAVRRQGSRYCRPLSIATQPGAGPQR